MTRATFTHEGLAFEVVVDADDRVIITNPRSRWAVTGRLADGLIHDARGARGTKLRVSEGLLEAAETALRALP